jgi:rhamnose utilization protein RhaD (predicted bifunctional aldolase and dehydrogenase)
MQFTSVSAEVAALTEAAAASAGEPSLCPGGMAAVSVKTADGGVVLTAARPGRPVDRLGLRTGWAALDAAAIAAVRDSEPLAALPTARQTDTVTDLLAGAVRLAAEDDPEPPGRDAWLLHALPVRWVLHLHPPAIDALVCAEDFATQAGPGLPLALRIAGEWNAYREEHRAGPAVAFLQNDGLLLTGDDWRPLLDEARDLAGSPM